MPLKVEESPNCIPVSQDDASIRYGGFAIKVIPSDVHFRHESSIIHDLRTATPTANTPSDIELSDIRAALDDTQEGSSTDGVANTDATIDPKYPGHVFGTWSAETQLTPYDGYTAFTTPIKVKLQHSKDSLYFGTIFGNLKGGLIIMQCGNYDDKVTADASPQCWFDINHDLYEMHKRGYLHCDIRLSNIMKFGERWHLIDYSLSVPSNNVITVNRTSGQGKGCGGRVKSLLEKSTSDEISVKWTRQDDHDMLLFCSHSLI